MIRIKTVTNTERKSFLTEANEVFSRFLAANNLVSSAAVAMLNGMVVSAGEYEKTFADLGVKDGNEATLYFTVKTTGA